ncbi:zinc finger MYND domain-containing protein [Chlamydiales bacterium]|nr:zinc finger MYND domain-containing protein [Chlamydiales bacterium]
MTSIISVQRACESCYKHEESTKFQTCGECRVIYYCSRDCQIIDWQIHKKACQSFKTRTSYYYSGDGHTIKGRTARRVKQGIKRLDLNTFNSSFNESEIQPVNLKDSIAMQKLLDRQEYGPIVKSVQKAFSENNSLETTEEVIDILNPYLKKHHASLFKMMASLLFIKYEFKNEKNEQTKAHVAEYISLMKIQGQLAECCCNDRSLNPEIEKLLEDFSQFDINLNDTALKELYVPKVITYLEGLDENSLPSPQWLANLGQVQLLGIHNIKPANQWPGIRGDKIKELLCEWRK